jgi:hypothetical protein
MAILHNRKAVNFIFFAATIAVLAGIIVFIVLARTGNSAQELKQRSEVQFSHANHSSGDFECIDCHHDFNENGENVIDDSILFDVEPDEDMVLNQPSAESADEENGVKCSSCHNTSSSINRMDAFHGQCIGCHEAQKIRPVFCGECHK